MNEAYEEAQEASDGGTNVSRSPARPDLDASEVATAIDALPTGAKRRASTDPMQRWHPYYAGYSLEFAESVLRALPHTSESTIVDPWNGSGTTTMAAARLGVRSVGVDLNPAAHILASARTLRLSEAKRVRSIARRIEITRPSRSRSTRSDALASFLTETAVAEFRAIQAAIASKCGVRIADGSSLSADSFKSRAYCFLLLALTCSARKIVRRRECSNPTLLRVDSDTRTRHRWGQLFDIWRITVDAMSSDLPLLSDDAPDIRLVRGDSANIDRFVSDADIIFSSPPYCTRLDYVEATSIEVAAIAPLLDDEGSASLRRQMMGAPLVRVRGRASDPVGFPEGVTSYLHEIRNHTSRDSSSYYYKTYHQYFLDALASMHAIARALRPGGLVGLVVQNSFYKDIEIDLARCFEELGRAAGLSHFDAIHMPVKSVIGSINPGTKSYRDSTTNYRESLVMMTKPKEGT